MSQLSRFDVESPAFIRHAPSSLVIGERFGTRETVVQIGDALYRIDALDPNPRAKAEDIAAFHLQRYPQNPLFKKPIKRPKK